MIIKLWNITENFVLKICFYFSLIGFFVVTGCLDNSLNPIDPDPVDLPPNFSLRSETIIIASEQKLNFYATCISDEILLDSIRIRNPRAENETVNFGGIRITSNQEFNCQKSVAGFKKYLGTWTFTFMGKKATGTKSIFSVAKSLNITGKVR